jgi:DNA replication protein DnaC
MLPAKLTELFKRPVSHWHEQIGDPTLADGILERLVHNAHRTEMRGDSMRKNRGKPNA